MNILHLKYAVEAAKAGSLSKAAEALYMNQPNLSRAIKELEAVAGHHDLRPQRQGRVRHARRRGVFVRYARKIRCSQVDERRRPSYKSGDAGAPAVLRVRAARELYQPRPSRGFPASWAATARRSCFTAETGAMQTLIRNLLQEDYKLGILRYA